MQNPPCLLCLVHDNLCYLTIKSDSGQHSQFLRCFNSKLFFHFRNYLAKDNTALEMSGEGLFHMSMKNVKPSPLWELIQIHALGKRNTQSDKKLKKCYKCEHELCNSEKHVRSSSGEKLYNYNLCYFSSSDASNLKTHTG